MKQMMRISFDLQMDIQRAIRQEVAAAMVAACNMQTVHIQTAGSVPPPPAVNGKLTVKHFNTLLMSDYCSWCYCWTSYTSDIIRPMYYLPAA